MDIFLSPEQRALKAEVREYLDGAYPPERVLQIERDREFPEEFWHECGRRGWTGLPVPIEYGGRGGGVLDLCVFVEEVARTCISLSTLYIAGTIFGSHALHICGTPEQRKRLLPRIARGETRFALAMSEPAAGSDFAGMLATAQRDGDAWRIDGLKGPISGAERADVLITAARTSSGGASRQHGITLFLVERDTPGVTFQRRHFAAMKALWVANVAFDGVRVEDSTRLGPLDEGWLNLARLMDIERTAASAQMVGVAQAALDDAVAYAQQRRQYGKPIGGFQGIAHPLADALTDINASRMLIWSAARKRDLEGPCPLEASMAKLFATNMAARVATAAMQTAGAVGYEAESHFVRRLLEARGGELGGGTSQIQRNIIARRLGLG
ncbi:acyl-CoA/acyl-ACP dehydrogenase [Candidatus Binatia bacterium]|nr:acyl-CoA/acyl-ACP dehydrogenase [Candidatus Binatia bacterium]